jgi:ketosteroid isomerase-like protein
MTVPGGAVYHGHDGVRRWWRDQEEAWGAGLRVEPEAYLDVGEHTLISYVARGRGSNSGAEVEMPFAGVIRWRGGLAIYYRSYLHRDDALRDLGVSEHELEPIEP